MDNANTMFVTKDALKKQKKYTSIYNIQNPPAVANICQHEMTEFVEEAITNGWAWEYKYHCKARGQTTICYDANYWKNFQKIMANVIGVKPKEIESIAVTNHDKNFSAVRMLWNKIKCMQEVDASKFYFQEKDSKNSRHSYGFMKVRGKWYGIVKITGHWYSPDYTREDGADNLAFYVGYRASYAKNLAHTLGFHH